MTAPDLASSSPSSPPPPDRAELIRTAVVFLRSPRVASASDDKKRLFLKSKSLSDAEVDVAMTLAADASHGGSDAAQNDAAEASLLQQRKIVSAGQVFNRNPQTASLFHGRGGRFLVLIVFGGFSYAIYYFYTKWVAPFLRRQRETDEKLAVLQESVRALQDNVALTVMKVQLAVEKLEASLQSRDSTIATMEARVNHNQSKLIAEVKQEVTSLKGVMLNVKNFPSTKLSVLDTKPSSHCSGGKNLSPPNWQLRSSSSDPEAATRSSPPAWQLGSSSVPENTRLSPSPSAASNVEIPLSKINDSSPEKRNQAEDSEETDDRRRPRSVPSRSASSSGSSATSFEVIERKDLNASVPNSKENVHVDACPVVVVETEESAEESAEESVESTGDSDGNIEGESESDGGSGVEGDVECGGSGVEGDVECGGSGVEADVECGGSGVVVDLEYGRSGLEGDMECGRSGVEGDVEYGRSGVDYVKNGAEVDGSG